MATQTEKERKQPVLFAEDEAEDGRKKVQAGLMFGVACVTSPCCTPLFVPLAIGLLAGTPLAVWIAANIGLVYGGLTLLSALSLVLSVHWWRQRSGIGAADKGVQLVEQSTIKVNG